MNDDDEVLISRRRILELAVGFLAAGCATTGGATNGTTQRSRPAQGFPYPDKWCFPNNPNALDLLGRMIMQERNPYCMLNQATAAPCDPNDTDKWPMVLTDETTYQLLTQFDYNARDWDFGGASPERMIQPSMRIPYLIKQFKAKKKNEPTFQKKLGFENLLVGFQRTPGSASSAAEWGDVAQGCSNKNSIGEFAQFIVNNMTLDTDKSYSVSPAPITLGPTNTKWQFRQLPIEVEYTFRFPVATGQNLASAKAGWIYVGYEGGGAY
jgi:hypothetical protein